MHFSIEREFLLKLLRLTSRVVDEKKSQNQIFNSVLLTVNQQDNSLTLNAMDNQIEIFVKESLNNKGEINTPGTILISHKKLNEICKAFADGEIIRIVKDDSKAYISVGRSKFTLSTLDYKQFPKSKQAQPIVTLTLDKNLLIKILENTAISMAEEDVRYFLNGMLLEATNNHLRAVATDGHRLTMRQILHKNKQIDPIRVIVPREGISKIIKVLHEMKTQTTDNIPQTIQIVFYNKSLVIICNTCTLTAKLLQGKYPDYTRVVPKKSDNVAIGNKIPFANAFSRASILFADKFKGVKFKFTNNKMTLLGRNSENDEIEDEVEVDYNGKDLDINLNIQYLIDFLNIISSSENVRIVFSDAANGSVLLEGEGDSSIEGVYVVMPMKV